MAGEFSRQAKVDGVLEAADGEEEVRGAEEAAVEAVVVASQEEVALSVEAEQAEAGKHS